MVCGYTTERLQKPQPLVEKGATLAPKPADVAQPGGIVVTMVADDRALEDLCLGERLVRRTPRPRRNSRVA